MRFIASVYLNDNLRKKTVKPQETVVANTPPRTGTPLFRSRVFGFTRWPMRPPTGVRLNTGQEATSTSPDSRRHVAQLQCSARLQARTPIPSALVLPHEPKVNMQDLRPPVRHPRHDAALSCAPP